MKHLFFLFILLPFSGQGQAPDSAALVLQIDSLNKTARSLGGAFRFEEALQTVGEAKTLVEENFGKSHPAYIFACNTEIDVHWRMGNYPQALSLAEETLQLQEDSFGKENAEYAGLLHLRGTLHLEMANYEPGEQDFLECLALRERILGKNSAPYAMTLNNLANLYGLQGEVDKSLAIHLEALQIRETVLGKESYDYSMSLNNLGRTYMRTGEYEKSIAYLSAGRALIEKTKGKNHPLVIFSSLNTAGAYTQLGQYGKAEEAFQETLKLTAASLGEEHPQYAFALNDLAQFYDLSGLPEKAKACLLQSIAIKEKTIGREHNYTLGSLINLAKIYQEEGRLEEAADLYLEADEIFRKNYGSSHPENIVALSNLANVYLEQGNYRLADSLHRATLAVRQQTFGNDHADCALSYMGIANCLRLTGRIEEGWEAMQEALRIFQKAYGRENLYTIKSHQVLAEAAWEMGQPELALQQADTFSLQMREHFRQSARHLSANELLLKMESFQPRLDFMHSARFNFGQQDPVQTGRAFDDALFYKGMLLENAIGLEKAVAEAPDSLRERYVNWKALQRRLAEAYAKPLGSRPGIDALERRAEELEKELVRHAFFRSAREITGWQEVQARLSEGEAAIEFVHFSWKNPQPTDSVLYAALLLRPGWEAPRWVALFEEKQIQPILSTKKVRRKDYAAQLFGNQGGVSLYGLLWQPLASYLEGVERIYFSPSGVLHRIPLSAIPDEKGQTLADRYILHQLGSTRQLVSGFSRGNALAANGPPTLFGGINYDMDSTAMASARSLAHINFSETSHVLPEAARSPLGGGRAWPYLPWTEVEAKTLSLIFEEAGMESRLFLGHEASEEAFRSLGAKRPSPRVLHVATHGYFYPDPSGNGAANSFSSGGPRGAFKISNHPMIRSGLILAGANHAWTGGEPVAGLEDGILTAYEASQMNLSNTELVVLSACETGLGDIRGDEGVFGLQRAFRISGARYLLMSLWQVSDLVTEELMAAFYLEWLREGKPIPEAFHAAQRQVKAQHPEPFFWAGFVLVE
ncbi:MAG: CHAT domain-containing protein [Phaeodactylibacter sp.]|nr:CHAT domain-containing protein [Phaeodactylibacter sp.]